MSNRDLLGTNSTNATDLYAIAQVFNLCFSCSNKDFISKVERNFGISSCPSDFVRAALYCNYKGFSILN